MKNTKKKGALFISLLLILSSSIIYIQTAKADTKIGDTSFGVNVGDVLTWIITESVGPGMGAPNVGDKIEYTIDSIFLDNSGAMDFIMVNVTVRYYNSSTPEWIVQYNGDPMPLMGYNDTNEEFHPMIAMMIGFSLHVLPIPLDLTLMINLINDIGGMFSATPVGTDGLNCTGPMGSTIYKYNSSGVATSFTSISAGTVDFKAELEIPVQTTFGFNEGDVITWACTQSIESGEVGIPNMGDKWEYTIDAISNLLNGGPSGFLLVNATLRYYNSTTGNWILFSSGILNGYNATTKSFYYGLNIVSMPIIPTPVDVNLISDIINTTTLDSAKPVGTNELNCTPFGLPDDSHYYTYNSNGLATTITYTSGSIVKYVWTLKTNVGPVATTFGVIVGDVLTYVITESSIGSVGGFNVSDKMELTIDSIYLDNSGPTDYLIVNATGRFYNSYTSEWLDMIDGNPMPLTGYNATNEEFYPPLLGNLMFSLYILPIPLDIMLMSQLINDTGTFLATPIGTNGLNCTPSALPTFLVSYTYNANGVATIFTNMQAGIVAYKMELVTVVEPVEPIESSFGVNVGDVLTYVVTESSGGMGAFVVGDKMEFTIDSIYIDIYGPTSYLVVNVTTRLYNSTTGLWNAIFGGVNGGVPRALMGYNATNEEFYPPIISGLINNLFILPIPLNVTLMSEIISNTILTPVIPIGTNGINITLPAFEASSYYTYNSSGVATTITFMSMGMIVAVMELETADGIEPPDDPDDTNDTSNNDLIILIIIITIGSIATIAIISSIAVIMNKKRT